jgi:tetratricopeptide (TPR) repeat protein
MTKRLLLVVLLAGLAVSCETTEDPTYVKDGVNYASTDGGVFRGRWWSYYERGSNLLSGEFYEAAEADLRKAIGMTRSSKDRWQARTYGLHFTEYFPRRELGITLLRKGELEEAETLLEQSLSQVDTARAHYYLDQLKKARLAQGSLSDTTAPVLDTSLDDVQLVATLDVNLNINARDDLGVETITVNGEALYQRGSAEKISYQQKVTLGEEGPQTIEIEATDLSEKVATKSVEIIRDLTGPSVGIREPEDALVTDAANVDLVGAAKDKYNVTSVRLGDTIIAETAGEQRLPFTSTMPLQDGANNFTVVARDAAGNETHTTVNVFKGDANSLRAKLWQIGEKDPRLLRVASASPNILALILQSLKAQEEEGLTIKLRSPSADRPWRNERAVRVSGQVTTGGEVVNLLINGVVVEQFEAAPKVGFNTRIVLDPELVAKGSATFEVAVVAADDAGKKVTEQVKIDIQPLELSGAASKMPLAVLAFQGSDDPTVNDGLRTMTEQEIGNTKRFTIVERQMLESILTEQQLSDALGSKDAALELGKIIPAAAFLVADIIQRGSEAEIIMRVINISTSAIWATVDTRVSDVNSLDSMREGCNGLAQQMRQIFPRIGGEIVQARGSIALLNWVEADGILEGMQVLVVEQEEPWIDEDTGEVLAEGETTIVGKLKITKVSLSNNSQAELVKDEDGKDPKIEPGMAIITM